MSPAAALLLDAAAREALWRRVVAALESHVAAVPSLRVAPALDRDALASLLSPVDFGRPMSPDAALDLAIHGLTRHQVHTPHPRYFGLFNPAPTTMGIAADALVAGFNPQLAAWSHSPFCAELEAHLCRVLGGRFGYDPAGSDGVFASGGAEANHTALLTALVDRFPSFAAEGARSLAKPPALYVSSQAHHSFQKAARLCGLGTRAVRSVPVDERLRLDVEALERTIAADRAAGGEPFFVVATAGTTGAGILDPIPAIADVAARFGLWLHADAAWGGAAALVPELAGLLDGVARADSITFDAHKWLSVPMGAGLYLTRHRGILERTFWTDAGYMPKDAAGLTVADPFAHSMQWSRRSIGLKVFLSLAVAGFDGYAEACRHMLAMGVRLRDVLAARGWRVVNQTPLPVVCCADASKERTAGAGTAEGAAAASADAFHERIVSLVVGSGRAWVSSVRLPGTGTAIRACITNYRTGPDDVDALVEALDWARGEAGRSA